MQCTACTNNLTSVMFDKSDWETPKEFNPGVVFMRFPVGDSSEDQSDLSAV